MEEFKSLEFLCRVDERHELVAVQTDTSLGLGQRHALVGAITVHAGVPSELRSQFNVARNLAVYQHFCYGFAPVVQLLTYTIIEFGLRIRAGDRRTGLKGLLRRAVDEGWIADAGFRRAAASAVDIQYCRQLIELLPSLRNEAAHGSNQMTPYVLDHLAICADFVNQLFPRPPEGDARETQKSLAQNR